MSLVPAPLSLLIESLVFFIVFSNVSKIKLSKLKSIGAVLSKVLIGFVIFEYLIYIWNLASIFGNIAMVVIISLIANTNIKNFTLSAFYAIFANVIFLMVGYVTGALILFVSNLILPNYELNPWILYFLYVSIGFIPAYIISYQIGNLFSKKISNFDIDLKRKFAKYMLIGASITLVYYFANAFLRRIFDPETAGMFYSLSLILHFVIITFATLFLSDKFQKEVEVKQHKELLDNLQSYTNNIEEMASEVRRFRHDNRNLLFGFYEHIKNEDVVGIRKYYDKYMRSFSENTDSQNDSIDKLANIKLPEIKSILLIKTLHAQRLNINVIVEINETIENIREHDSVSLCRIIGILMDNAIEACLKIKGAGVPASLRFMFAKNGADYVLAISNTCVDPPPLSQMFDKGYTTKESGSGLGLYTVSLLVDEDENLFLSTHIEGEWFTQKLIISVNNDANKRGG